MGASDTLMDSPTYFRQCEYDTAGRCVVGENEAGKTPFRQKRIPLSDKRQGVVGSICRPVAEMAEQAR
jgi:hypothetical protein